LQPVDRSAIMRAMHETSAAIAAVRAGLSVAVARVDADERTPKQGNDFATGADIAAEDAIRRVLLERHPEIALVGEERGGDPPPADRPYWLIDPICGTLNYASHLALWCTNVALVERGQVALSVVGDGGSHEIYFAERGRGAYRLEGEQPRPLHARETSVLGIELAGKPPYADSAHTFGRIAAELAAGGRFDVRLLGTTLSFAKLATGDLAGLMFLGTVAEALHTAAGCLLAQEAGATLTDLAGQPWNLTTTAFVGAASPTLHAELLALVRHHS
jgi:myo-inositol-1(or 4)-monophosphatase